MLTQGSRLPPVCNTGLLGRRREGGGALPALTCHLCSRFYLRYSLPGGALGCTWMLGEHSVSSHPPANKEGDVIYLTAFGLQPHVTRVQAIEAVAHQGKSYTVVSSVSCWLHRSALFSVGGEHTRLDHQDARTWGPPWGLTTTVGGRSDQAP